MNELYLFHDPGLTFREGNVSTRLILDELDVNLPPLPTRLVIIVVVIVAGCADARALDTATLGATVPGRESIVLGAGGLLVIGIGDVGHGRCRKVTKEVTSLISPKEV